MTDILADATELKAVGKWVLIESLHQDKSEGGLYIPNTASQECGKVHSIGNLCDLGELKPGDIAYFKLAHYRITDKKTGATIFTVKEEDVICRA